MSNAVQVVAVRSGALPAERVVNAALDGVSPGGSWVAAGNPSGAVNSPFDFDCGAPDGPGPVISRMRGFSQSTSSLSRDITDALTVNMRAYSAGLGAVAYNVMQTQVAGCHGVSLGNRNAPGVQAMVVRTSRAMSFVTRRADVITIISSSALFGPAALSVVTGVAEQVDTQLMLLLTPVCADVNATISSASRSLRAGVPFTGSTINREAVLPPDATGVAVSAVAPNVTVAPVPVVVLPVRPADPILPTALPAVVPAPVPPVAPSAAPTSMAFTERVTDPIGPGCGWAFTGQMYPTFDPVRAQAAVIVAEATSQIALAQANVIATASMAAFQSDLTVFNAELAAFLVYAEKVSEVSRAWQATQVSRESYASQVTAYNAAVSDAAAFNAQKQAASSSYNAAVASCAANGDMPAPASAPPAPSGSPAVGVLPGTGGVIVLPSGLPVALPSAAPSASPASQVCPPVRPVILDQNPPQVPAPPVAPTG